MEKCIIDIKLLNEPRVGLGKCEKNINCGGFDNRAKSFMIVNARSLVKAFGYKAGFATED